MSAFQARGGGRWSGARRQAIDPDGPATYTRVLAETAVALGLLVLAWLALVVLFTS